MTRRARQLKTFTAAVLGTFAAGCTGANTAAPAAAASAAVAAEPSGTHLRDPADVTVKRDRTQLSFNAPNGALVARDVSAADIIVCLQQVSVEDLQAAVNDKTGFGGSHVTTLARAQATAQGAFQLAVDATAVDANKLVVINVTGECATDAVVSNLRPDVASIVVKPARDDATFTTVAKHHATAMPFCGSVRSATDEHPIMPPSGNCDVDVSFDVSNADNGSAITKARIEIRLDADCAAIADGSACTAPVIATVNADAGLTYFFRSGLDYRLRFLADGYETYEEVVAADKAAGRIAIVLTPRS